MSDTEKIIEISLAKIESSKTKKGNGKLHKKLLVNSLLNRVRGTDSENTCTEPLMNYREPKLIVDLDVDDYDMDRVPSYKERTISQQRLSQSSTARKQSSLVSKLNTRSLGKTDNLQKNIVNCIESCEMKENVQRDIVICDCSKRSMCCSTCNVSKRTKKRIHSIELLDDECPRKRLRCLWTPRIDSKSQDPSFSVTSLSSLFGNLVAHSADNEKRSLDLRNKFVSAMVAC